MKATTTTLPHNGKSSVRSCQEKIARAREVPAQLSVSTGRLTTIAIVSSSAHSRSIDISVVVSGNDQTSSLLPNQPPSFTMAECASPNTIRNADADINIKPQPYAEMMSPKLGGASRSRRSFYDRTFTKLEKGSVRGSIFNLVSAALGGGVLSLSYVFVLSGWATGLILIALGTVAGIWSNMLIATMAIDHKIPNLDQIAFHSGGNCLRKFLQIMMLVYASGACIGYQIFIAELV